MMTGLTLKIYDVLDNLSDSAMVDVHNRYCEAVKYYDDIIDRMDSLDDFCYGMKATQILDTYKNNDFNTSDNYYVLGVYGATSFDRYIDAPATYYDEISQYCAENDADFDCADIRNCIDEWNDKQEKRKENNLPYNELRKKHADEMAKFPLGAAFSNEQFNEMMAKWELDPDKDVDKIYSIGGGCYIQKKDADTLDEMLARHDKEIKEFMEDLANFENAIYYEMANHEYLINGQATWDVCSCFGSVDYRGNDLYGEDELREYARQLGWSENQIQAYKQAYRKYYNDAMENGWY